MNQLYRSNIQQDHRNYQELTWAPLLWRKTHIICKLSIQAANEEKQSIVILRHDVDEAQQWPVL